MPGLIDDDKVAWAYTHKWLREHGYIPTGLSKVETIRRLNSVRGGLKYVNPRGVRAQGVKAAAQSAQSIGGGNSV